nr:IS66 family insertion sequence element accessory protein TnpB [Pectinatus cerevisiiphilus]
MWAYRYAKVNRWTLLFGAAKIQDGSDKSLFLFSGRKHDRLKALLFEGDGFVLLYKRLENGKFQWSDTPEEVLDLSRQQLRWLLEGLCINQPKAVKKITSKSCI